MAAPVDLELKKVRKRVEEAEAPLWSLRDLWTRISRRRESCGRKEAPGSWGVISRDPKTGAGLLRLEWGRAAFAGEEPAGRVGLSLVGA